MKIAIIYSHFHFEIVKNLLKGCDKFFNEQKIDSKNIEKYDVPGAFEIPLVCQKLAKSKKYQAIITLGCVIRGQTLHYEMICQATTKAIMDIMLQYETPIIFEILMVNDMIEARNRANTKNWQENKGYIAAQTTLIILNSKL